MSYQVLARKWRPQTFSELVGQQHVVDAITNALENNKLHHAYLFTGTRGVGKTTIARIFSKSLNCEQGQSANPCGKCDTCVDISDGRYVDLLEIDAASRTKVEDTRELLDNVQYRPTRGKYKVYLIDEVHMLSKHSFNALLKTLEEPPEHVKFLLATTDPQKLPVTVLSRCLQFSLKALTKEQIQGHLQQILDQEQVSYEVPALAQLARAAQGSIRDSLSLTDQAIAQGNNQVSLATVVNMLGLLNKNHILKLLKFICERDSENALAQLDEICSSSPDYPQVLAQVLGLLHQIALTQVVPEVCKLESDSAKGVYTLAKALSKEHVQMLYQIALNGKRDLPHAPDGRVGLEMTILRMLAFTPAQKIELDVDALISDEHANLPVPNIVEVVPSAQTVNQQPNARATDVEKAQTSVEQQEQSADERQFDAPEQPLVTSTETQDTPAHEQVAELDLPETVSSTKPDVQGFDSESTIAPISDDTPVHHEELPMLDDMFGDIPPQQDYGSQNSAMDDRDYDAQQTAMHQDINHDAAYFEPETPLNQQNVPHQHSSENTQNSSLPADSSSNDNTLALIENNKKLRQLREQEEGETGKKPEAVTDTAEQDAVSTSYKLGDQFTAFAQTPYAASIPAFLPNGEKVTNAAQVDQWSAFVDSTGLQALTRQLLIHANCTQLAKPLVIKIEKDVSHLAEEAIIERVQTTLSDMFKETIDVNIEFGPVENTPFQIQSNITNMRQKHAEHVVASDPTIQELIKAFDATVMQDSVEAR